MPRKSAKSAGGSAVVKQRFNVYTMMLLLSLIAIITACFLLWFGELAKYDWPPMDAGAAKATSWVVPAPSEPFALGSESSLLPEAVHIAAL